VTTGAGNKILFFSGGAHRALDPSARVSSGGAELQVALLARALAARGRRCVIAAAGRGFEDGIEWSGVKIRAAGRFDSGGLWDTLAALGPVCAVLAGERPGIVVVYGWTAWLAVLCVLGRVMGFRVVYVCALDGEISGEFRRRNPVRGALFEWGMRAAAARFAITDAQAEAFRARGMPCAVTRLLRAPLSEDEPAAGPVDLLWVARCHPVKRPILFLDLAERLPEARCRMVCSPQDRGLWEEVRARAAAMPHVEFLEGVPYRAIQGHFRAARVFVNTSEDEGVPNTFLHAAEGGAAIASLQADPDGMLRRFGCGFCAGGSFEALVGGVRQILESADARRAAASGGERLLAEWHDNAANVDAFLRGLPA
jgi:hypothetical protein